MSDAPTPARCEPAETDRIEASWAGVAPRLRAAILAHRAALAANKHGETAAMEAALAAADAVAWRPMMEAPRNGTPVWLCVNGQQTEAWYDPLKVATDYEGNDASTGAVWVCADDQWQIEVEEEYLDGVVHYHDGKAIAWRELPAQHRR